MILTASEVASLATQLFWWEIAEYVFAGLVTVGCFGEFVAEFTDWFTGGEEASKKRLEKRSTLLLVGALALELVCLVKTNQLSGMVIGSLNELATGADDKARKALGDSSTAIAQAGRATAKAGSAEQASNRALDKSIRAEGTASNAIAQARGARQEADSFERDIKAAREEASKANSELTRIKTPRTISGEQQEQLTKALQAFAGTPFDLSVFMDEESVALMRVLRSVLTSAGWKQQADGSGFGLPETPGPFVGVTSATGIHIEIALSRYADLGPAATTLMLVLKAENLDVAANAVATGVIPTAIHISVGKKNP